MSCEWSCQSSFLKGLLTIDIELCEQEHDLVASRPNLAILVVESGFSYYQVFNSINSLHCMVLLFLISVLPECSAVGWPRLLFDFWMLSINLTVSKLGSVTSANLAACHFYKITLHCHLAVVCVHFVNSHNIWLLVMFDNFFYIVIWLLSVQICAMSCNLAACYFW